VQRWHASVVAVTAPRVRERACATAWHTQFSKVCRTGSRAAFTTENSSVKQPDGKPRRLDNSFRLSAAVTPPSADVKWPARRTNSPFEQALTHLRPRAPQHQCGKHSCVNPSQPPTIIIRADIVSSCPDYMVTAGKEFPARPFTTACAWMTAVAPDRERLLCRAAKPDLF
jgi:hypothetical protein